MAHVKTIADWSVKSYGCIKIGGKMMFVYDNEPRAGIVERIGKGKDGNYTITLKMGDVFKSFRFAKMKNLVVI
jgi:hypothetical protein